MPSAVQLGAPTGVGLIELPRAIEEPISLGGPGDRAADYLPAAFPFFNIPSIRAAYSSLA